MVAITKHDHINNIEKAIIENGNGDEKLVFYSDSDKVLISKSFLMMFSPVIRSLVASLPCCTAPSISIPGFSLQIVQHLVRILESGYTTGVPTDSFKQVYEIIELAKLLDIDVSDLRCDRKSNLSEKGKEMGFPDLNKGIDDSTKNCNQDIESVNDTLPKEPALKEVESKNSEEISFKLELDVSSKCIKKEEGALENRSEHIIIHKNEVDVLVRCQICEYKTHHRMNLERHYLTHFGGEMNTLYEQVSKDLKCSLCKHESKTKANMKTHLVLKHKYLDKVLQGKGYEAFSKKIKKGREKDPIRKDKQIEEPKTTIKKHCDLRNKLISFLDDKEKRSGNNSPKLTPVSSRADDINIKRPFACDKCSKTFVRTGDFRRHKKLHTGIKPYKCNYCSYACVQKVNLKVHVKRVHRTEYNLC